MARRKPTPPSSRSKELSERELVPIWVRQPGEPPRPPFFARSEDVLSIVAALVRDNRAAEERGRQAADRQAKKSMSSKRFKEGLMLITWIDHLHGGKLT